MMREVLIFLAALIAGAIIHILAIFSLPNFAQNDIWHKVLDLGPIHRVHVISSAEEAVAISADLDPAFAFGFCRTDVSQAPVALKGQLSGDFWSLDYVDEKGSSQFSLTNQTSGHRVNILLATKGQQRLISERPDMLDPTTIVISANGDKGILVLRVFVSSDRDRSKIADSIGTVKCSPLWDETVLKISGQ